MLYELVPRCRSRGIDCRGDPYEPVQPRRSSDGSQATTSTPCACLRLLSRPLAGRVFGVRSASERRRGSSKHAFRPSSALLLEGLARLAHAYLVREVPRFLSQYRRARRVAALDRSSARRR
jgi:hypothetical protein